MKTKILFVYKDEGELKTESVWASKHGENYKIDNIPFFISNIALGDIVSAEADDGGLYFDSLIKPSGHSAIQIVFFDVNQIERIAKELENLGCHWEGTHIKAYISVDIPPAIPFNKVRDYLKNQTSLKLIDYKEACIRTSHRRPIFTQKNYARQEKNKNVKSLDFSCLYQYI